MAANGPDDVEWDVLLAARVVPLTGITAALSDSCRDLVLTAASRAHDAGRTVCYDINYRRHLASPAESEAIVRKIAPDTDVLICKRADAATLFGLTGTPEQIATRLTELLSIPRLVVTCGLRGAVARWDGQRSGCPGPPVQIVDRIGAGDAFAGCMLTALLRDRPIQDALRQGVAAASYVMSLSSDHIPPRPCLAEELAALGSPTEEILR